ncbi:hypothetical protein CFP56_034112 [Quercus suber]|uniref:Uncharacterized protein n=1 Tax=Quercus suber TaxID=58331 RepID=A0AAW0LU07_QUESU
MGGGTGWTSQWWVANAVSRSLSQTQPYSLSPSSFSRGLSLIHLQALPPSSNMRSPFCSSVTNDADNVNECDFNFDADVGKSVEFFHTVDEGYSSVGGYSAQTMVELENGVNEGIVGDSMVAFDDESDMGLERFEDPCRGYAWTQALLGLKADEIRLYGDLSPSKYNGDKIVPVLASRVKQIAGRAGP